MSGAIITVDQSRPGPSTSHGSPGVARNDLWVGWAVQLLDGAGGNNAWAWSLLRVPPGSAVELAGADPQGIVKTASAAFTPDVPGSYRIRLITGGGGPGNIQIRVVRVRYDVSGALANDGVCLPAFGEQEGESNYNGNLVAWAEPIEYFAASTRTRIKALEDAQPFNPAVPVTTVTITQSIVLGDPASGATTTFLAPIEVTTTDAVPVVGYTIAMDAGSALSFRLSAVVYDVTADLGFFSDHILRLRCDTLGAIKFVDGGSFPPDSDETGGAVSLGVDVATPGLAKILLLGAAGHTVKWNCSIAEVRRV